MAGMQKYFEKFHSKIRADYGMDSTLREKRDIVLDRIRKHLKDSKLPGFEVLHQGSYKMKTGVKPIGTIEYDIDVGLRFSLSKEDYDTKTVRSWVLEAVEGHTKETFDKGPCIRVAYAGGYHLDLVCYSREERSGGGEDLFLAHKSKGWRSADPLGLAAHVDNARDGFSDTEDSETGTDQLRRVIRYLKRWYDVAIQKDSDAKPSGLAYTLLSIERTWKELSWDGKPNDLIALRRVADHLATHPGRPSALKPTPEYEDLFAGLTDAAIEKLKTRAASLVAAIDEAQEAVDPVDACKALRKVLGDDFPVPDPDDTGKKQKSAAIITPSTSA